MVWTSCLHQFPLSPKSHAGVARAGLSEWCIHDSLCPSFGILSLENPSLLKWLLENLLNLCPVGKDDLCYPGQETNLPFAREGATISSFQGCSTDILGSSFKVVARHVETSWRIFSQSTLLLSGVFLSQIFTWFSPSFYSGFCLNVTFPDHPISPPSPFLCSLGSIWHMNLTLDWLSAFCELHGVQKFVLFTVESTAPGIVPDRVSDH